IVVDEQGKPLIMATITEKDEDNEMRIWAQKLPNAKGQFTIRVYDLSHYLSVSCPGYETRKVKISGQQLKVVLKESSNTTKLSTTDTSPIEGEILRICENMPQFPGGEQAMLKFIAENAHYPESAQKAGVEGMTVVEFIVDKKGKIHAPRVVRGLTPAFDEEVLRVVRAMPDWEPGTHRGEKKNVKYTLPVSFKLDQAKKQLSQK
ncbi:MAG: TonB family protein, partial [Prevotella sp.]|nr:TonB family protein [Prevotella sp.]